MARTNQGGSIVSFIVVGGVLTLLLVGGAYWVHHQNSVTTPTPTPAEEVDEQAAGPAEEQPDEQATSPSQESTDPSQEQATGSGEEQADDQTAGPAEEQADEQSVADDSTAGSGSSEGEQTYPTAGGESQPEELPATGPVDTVVSLVGASSLTVALIWYYRSRSL